MRNPRRFPPPWAVEQPACFVVRDHNGQQLAYVYGIRKTMIVLLLADNAGF
jgi:hypothetical protein